MAHLPFLFFMLLCLKITSVIASTGMNKNKLVIPEFVHDESLNEKIIFQSKAHDLDQERNARYKSSLVRRSISALNAVSTTVDNNTASTPTENKIQEQICQGQQIDEIEYYKAIENLYSADRITRFGSYLDKFYENLLNEIKDEPVLDDISDDDMSKIREDGCHNLGESRLKEVEAYIEYLGSLEKKYFKDIYAVPNDIEYEESPSDYYKDNVSKTPKKI